VLFYVVQRTLLLAEYHKRAYTIFLNRSTKYAGLNTWVLCLPRKQATRGGNLVSAVTISENESFEVALKRFNRKIQQDGILSEARRREHYEKPSVKRKRKEAARRRKTTHK